MTDLDIWKEFFNKYNIEFKEVTTDKSKSDIWKDSLSLETSHGEGYSGFTFTGVFNKDGSFRCYGVWE